MANTNVTSDRVETIADTDDSVKTSNTAYSDKVDGGSENEKNVTNDAPQHTMTTAVWLACIALGFAYTTAFQQNACTAAIVKHIDTELGNSKLTYILCNTNSKKVPLLTTTG
jgi:hypothetical protein